jgi:integrase
MTKLTKRTVDVLDVAGREYFESDDEIPGFGVRVFPSGRKTYVIQYKVGGRGGETRRKALGQHGVITAEEARNDAKRWLADRAKGKDPIADHRANLKSETLEQLARRYLEAAEKALVLGKRGQPKKPSTLMTDRGRIEHHIIPLLGKKRVRDVTCADVARFIRDITQGKTAADERTGPYGRAIVKGGAGTAARTAGLFSGIMAFAVQDGVRSDNPCHGVRKPAPGTRERRLDPEEYRALGKALNEFVAAGGNPLADAMVRVLALTGMRLGEVQGLRCAEIDRNRRALRLGNTKTGSSVRPLSLSALSILDSVSTRVDSPFAFPSPWGNGPYLGLRNAFRRIVASRPELAGVTPHTLRHSFASTASDLGLTELIVGALIGHRTGSVTSRYVHPLDAVLIAAADRVATQIEKWMRGATAGEIINFSERASATGTNGTNGAQPGDQAPTVVGLYPQHA